jgi:mono/diheme cytochrome c family protein
LPALLLLTHGLSGQPGAGGRIAGDVKKGRVLFRNCEGCHASVTDERILGPSLKGLFRRPKLANGQRTSEESVRKIILDGTKTMPAWNPAMKKERVQDLLAYLATL